MLLRRALIIGGILLVLFLAMYSWNRRTGVLDDLAANIGLEVSSWVLSPLGDLRKLGGDFWNRYFDLVDVRGENIRLKERVNALEARLIAHGEELAELKRLRELVQFPVDVRWRPLAARVLAGRMGPNAVLDSITISRGYVNGARPGIPLVTNLGLVGRILRSSAHASTALLVTDPGSRVAVFGQESRAAGILKGGGTGQKMEVDFVQRAAGMKDGEILITSGLDDKYPKGLPVARVTSVAPSDYTQFMAVSAEPLVDIQHLEEVLLLEKTGKEAPPEEYDGPIPVFVGPPAPPALGRSAPLRPSQPAQNSGEVSQEPPAAVQAAEIPRPETSRKAAPQQGQGAKPAPHFRVITP